MGRRRLRATIAEPIDFLGVNYYHPEHVRADPERHPDKPRRADAGPTEDPAAWPTCATTSMR
jgi:beta-glucosidase/6-phospho-beta-glucosidase/beta-galactosidase